MSGNKLALRVLSVIAGLVIVALSFWVGTSANSWLLPPEATQEAVMVDKLFRATLVIATGIFLFVQATILYSVVAFRQQPGDTSDGPPIHGNVNLEIFWTAVPAALVLWVSVYSYDVSNKTAAGGSAGLGCSVDCPMIVQKVSNPTGKELYINVLAQQYGWTFTYPGLGGSEVGEMHIPAGQEVVVSMQAKDVIHGFWVPDFRLKQDVIPGRVTRLRFTGTKIGEYALVCSELCGGYHGVMRSQVIIDSPSKFNQWVKTELTPKTASLPVSGTKLALK